MRLCAGAAERRTAVGRRNARAGNRLASLSRLGSSAVQLGLSRMARLEADGCAAASGTAQSGRFSERWTVQPARGLRRISLTISTTWQGRLRTWRYDTAVLCTVELP